MTMKEHLLHECYLSYNNFLFSTRDLMDDGDELCDQLWAEIHIMRTMKVRDLR